MYFDLLPVEIQYLTIIRRRRRDYKTASHHFVNLFLLSYSPVGEYKERHVKFYQSQRRISYIHLCKNTDKKCFHLKNSNFL